MSRDALAACLAELVDELPEGVVAELVSRLEAAPDGVHVDDVASAMVWQPATRPRLQQLLAAWNESTPAPPANLAAMMRAAAAMDRLHRNRSKVELVGSGPAPHGTTFRRTDRALLDLIASARRKLLVVTYSAYDIPALRAALLDAVGRGVDVHLVLESPVESAGKVRGDPLKAMGPELASKVSVWVWPLEKRPSKEGEGHGVLHAKCAVADEAQALVSSANLTGHAMELNLEVGLLVLGGDVPRALLDHFSALMSAGCLRRAGAT